MKVELGDGEIDLDSGLVIRRGLEQVLLRDKERELLRCLVGSPNCTLTRGELYDRVWEYHPQTRSRTLDSTVRRLRKSIEMEPSSPKIIVSDVGVGYRYLPVTPALQLSDVLVHFSEGRPKALQAMSELSAVYEEDELIDRLLADWVTTIRLCEPGRRLMQEVGEQLLNVNSEVLRVLSSVRRSFRLREMVQVCERLGVVSDLVNTLQVLQSHNLLTRTGDRILLSHCVQRSTPVEPLIEVLNERLTGRIHLLTGATDVNDLLFLREVLPELRYFNKLGKAPFSLRLAGFHGEREFGESARVSDWFTLNTHTERLLFAYFEGQATKVERLSWLSNDPSPLGQAVKAKILVLDSELHEFFECRPSFSQIQTDTQSCILWLWEVGQALRIQMKVVEQREVERRALRLSEAYTLLQLQCLLYLAQVSFDLSEDHYAYQLLADVEGEGGLGKTWLNVIAKAKAATLPVALRSSDPGQVQAVLEQMQAAVVPITINHRQVKSSFLLQTKAMAYLELGDLKKTESLLHDLNTLGERTSTVYFVPYMMAWVYLCRGEYQAAKHHLLRTESNEHTPWIDGLLGLCHRLLGDDEAALSVLQPHLQPPFCDRSETCRLFAIGLHPLAALSLPEIRSVALSSRHERLLALVELAEAAVNHQPLPAPVVVPETGVELTESVRMFRRLLECSGAVSLC